MTIEPSIKPGIDWSTIVANGLKTKIPLPRSRFDISGNKESYSVETLFEVPEVAQYQRSQRVHSIVQTAIQPGAVIFSVPSRLFSHQSEAFKLVVDQIGPVVGNYFNPVSLRGTRSRGELVFYTRFRDDNLAQVAIAEGITHNGVQYKAVPYKDKCEANDHCRVTLTLPIGAEPDDLLQNLQESMSHYGRVLQVKQRLNHGFFEGDVSVLIDRQSSEGDSPYQELQRMLYLEAWDITVPVSYKGAKPVCYYCRQEGHVKKDCPTLQKLVCFRCGGHGHTQRRCRVSDDDAPKDQPVEKASSFSEVLDAYEALTAKDSHLDKDAPSPTMSTDIAVDPIFESQALDLSVTLDSQMDEGLDDTLSASNTISADRLNLSELSYYLCILSHLLRSSLKRL